MNKWSVYVAENLAQLFGSVSINGTKTFLSTVNPVLLYRLDTFFSKEPETIKWLDEIGPNDTVYDVGANVGLYSLYAARRGAKVLAFEPVFYNFSIINTNIAKNNLGDLIVAYPFALSSGMEFGKMHLTNLIPGGAFSSFGKEESAGIVHQGSVSYSIDELIEEHNFPIPSHIKIDVDGLESKIVGGMIKTLQKPELKNVLIEIDETVESDINIVSILEESGFKIAEQGSYPDSGSKVRNYIFKK